MEGKANIQIGQVNNLEKQKVSLTYYVVGCDSVEDAQSIKYAIDAVAQEYGCVIHEDARITGEEIDTKAKRKAAIASQNIEEKD